MKSSEILVIDTGGTFNKYYDPIVGELRVDTTGKAVDTIAEKARLSIEHVRMIGKDSLHIDSQDRLELLAYLHTSPHDKCIVVHGTDTMYQSAQYLDEAELEKQIVFTGAMFPWCIAPDEAVANFTLAYAFCKFNDTKGVFVAMHGEVAPYTVLVKDKKAGIFKKIETD